MKNKKEREFLNEISDSDSVNSDSSGSYSEFIDDWNNLFESKDTSKNNQIKFIDLFCGIGSFHYSFKKLGWKCIMASDINESARKNYKNNHNITPLGDICDIDPKTIENYDILTAGIPCQAFSQIGKHLGFTDERGTMFYQVMKFVKHHKPTVIIIENVAALLTHENGESFNKIKLELEKENYKVIHKIIICSDYGIPQMRKRLFIIAIKNNHKNISQIDKVFDLKKYEKKSTLSEYLNKNFEKKIAYTLRCGGRRSPIDDKHNWDGYYVDKKEYRLTIGDGLKLQGFTDPNFKLTGSDTDIWKLLGNTIPTNFTDILGRQINELFFI